MARATSNTHVCGHPRLGDRPNCIVCQRESCRQWRLRKKLERMPPPDVAAVFITLARKSWR
jgi:hypothetical protein